MIKYITIPGYKNLGECGLFSHLYQFKALTPDKDDNYPMIFIRSYDVPAILWHGNLLTKSKECIHINKELDLSYVEKVIGPVKQLSSFKEFIAGHIFEPDFNDFTFKD
jgi:hypothetical protein